MGVPSPHPECLRMIEKIKLIWDFRGPDSARTASHFHRHLRESPHYRADLESGIQTLGDSHNIAYLIVPGDEMPHYRDTLRPHRGEVHPNPSD